MTKNDQLKEYAESKGMIWDQPTADQTYIDLKALKIGDQRQVAILKLHIDHVERLFEPRTYTRWGRFLIALHFLAGVFR